MTFPLPLCAASRPLCHRGRGKGVLLGSLRDSKPTWDILNHNVWRHCVTSVTGICGCIEKTLSAVTGFCGSLGKPSQSASCGCQGEYTLWPAAHQSSATVIYPQCSIGAVRRRREAAAMGLSYLCSILFVFVSKWWRHRKRLAEKAQGDTQVQRDALYSFDRRLEARLLTLKLLNNGIILTPGIMNLIRSGRCNVWAVGINIWWMKCNDWMFSTIANLT